MLYSLLYSLHKYIRGFNVFRYITFRCALAALTAFLCVFILGPFIIKKLKKFQIKVKNRDFTPKRHQRKRGIPTMGGIIILFSIIISSFLWSNLKNRFIWLALISISWLGLIGFIDDYLKFKKTSVGLLIRYKLLFQIILGIILGIYLIYFPLNIAALWQFKVIDSNYQNYLTHNFTSYLTIPFLKNCYIKLGLLYISFICLVLVGSSNAVNLTDGLDGLAIGCVTLVAGVYGIFAYLTGNWKISQYLNILFVEGSEELALFCATIVGAGLGFLWFNTYPSQIFMGDTGSLALGGAIGIVALLIKEELLLAIVGGIFVLEAISVILQLISMKIRKKKIFKMTPLHHHFEVCGWPESKIVVRFWIIGIILALIGLSTLKLR